MKKINRRISVTIIISITVVILLAITITTLYLWKRSIPHPDKKLEISRTLIEKGELIGKNIDICDNYFGKPTLTSKLDNKTNKKIFPAGYTYVKVFGMSDKEYYNIVVFYNEDEVIFDTDIELTKGG